MLGCDLTRQTKGVTEMLRFLTVVRSRAGLILGSAIVTMLVLPLTAFAGGFSGPRGVHHAAATGGGGSGELAIFLGIVAMAILSVLILGRVGVERDRDRWATRSIRRKPAGVAS
jgi:hypothetical protein